MESDRELVILIPALARRSQMAYGDRLSDSIENYLETHREFIDSYRRVGCQGVNRAQFDIRFRNGEHKVVDTFEVSWNDLRPEIRQSSIPLAGFLLIGYWLNARMFRSIPPTSRSMRRAFVLGVLFLLVWYGITLLAVAQFSQLFPVLFSKSFQTWVSWIWVFATALLASRYVNDGIDGSYTTYCYLKNRGGLRDRVRRRIISAFWEVRERLASYSRITVLAHSFGSAVAVDAIADIATAAREEQPLHQLDLTIGSPLEYLTFREPTIMERIERCAASPIVTRWVDFYASTDSLCSKVPFGTDRKCFSEAIELGYSELGLVSRKCGWSEARGAFQVHDIERFLSLGRFGSRTLFSW